MYDIFFNADASFLLQDVKKFGNNIIFWNKKRI